MEHIRDKIYCKEYWNKKKDAFVYSSIESPDFPTTNIVWRVRDLGKGLKVIDMQVEGVSLLRTKRNDFKSTRQSRYRWFNNDFRKHNQLPDLKIPGDN